MTITDLDFSRTYTEPKTVSWPEPEITSMDGLPGPNKRAVKDLQAYAGQRGWSSVVTYARGSWPSVGQKPSRPKDSLAVRLWRGEERAVAVYVEASTWQWQTLYRWSLGQQPAKIASITDLLETL